MRQRSSQFLVVCLLMFYGESFGQKIPDISYTSTILTQNKGLSFEKEGSMKFWKKSPGILLTHQAAKPLPNFISQPFTTNISPSYSSDHFGFFCKKELQLQKITSVLISFRLGSLDYVNYLERKPNALK